MVGDAPQRAALLYIKHANNKTLHPCTLCNVTQSQEETEVGGDLGKRHYDILGNRRTRGQILAGRRRIRDKGIGTSAAAVLSRELGLIQPADPQEPSALYDLVSLHQPMETCGPELLHLNHIVSV